MTEAPSVSSLDRPTRRAAIAALACGVAGILEVAPAGAQTGAERREPAPAPSGASATAAWRTFPPTPSLPAAARSGLLSIKGASIFYAQFGQGPSVLLLHGGLGNSNYWGHQVRRLAQDFCVTAMDTRGHGRSPVVSAAFSYELFAEDATALLDFLQVPRTSIVGWSDGAITGLELAIRKPDRVTKLFAFGANSSADGLKAGGARSPAFVAYARRCRAEYSTLSPHPERWPQLLDGLRAMWRREPNLTKKDLAAVKAPTTISDGEYDEIIRREHTEQMASAIGGARLVILPGVSHFAMLQNPAKFSAALLEFLAA